MPSQITVLPVEPRRGHQRVEEEEEEGEGEGSGGGSRVEGAMATGGRCEERQCNNMEKGSIRDECHQKKKK